MPAIKLSAQEDPEILPERSIFKEPDTKFWINTYGNIRIAKKWFWVAQTHFRFQEDKDIPFAGQIAQVYNRHAIGYIYSKKINFALGGVLRLNFDTKDENEDRDMIPEYRIWHQYQFAMPVGRAVAYHRFRIEHRWSKGFKESSEYIFRNRWRYMFRLKIPVNKPKIESNVFYIAPEAELIMQSGKKWWIVLWKTFVYIQVLAIYFLLNSQQQQELCIIWGKPWTMEVFGNRAGQ